MVVTPIDYEILSAKDDDRGCKDENDSMYV